MRQHQISTLCIIVGVLLGLYVVNGERIFKRSPLLYSGDRERLDDDLLKVTKASPKTISRTATSSVSFASSLPTLPTVANSLPVSSCPAPFIPDPSPSLKKPTCANGCCLACPYANNFYPPNTIDNIYTALSGFRVVSFICVFIILLSYLVLPNKREQQSITVLCLNFSLLIFLSVTFFYIGDHRKVQCVDEYTQSNMINNPLCEFQGIILIFSTFTTILYCFLLIIQLHLQTVWRCNIIQQYYTITQCLVVVVSLIFTILPTITQQISFEFGAVCLVSMKMINQYFWYPLAIIVIPGFFIHIWTFAYIAKSQCLMNDDFDSEDTLCESPPSISVQSIKSVSGKDVVNSIKVQWRALVLSMVFLLTFIIYWVYIYVVKVKLSPLLNSQKSAWLNKWFLCVMTVSNTNSTINAQDYCYSTVSSNYVPSILFICLAESLTAILGLSIFVVFGTSINLWNEWRAWFRGRYGGVYRG
ncbi:250_t:CDS:2 [Acaulospora morrowiae]|uniref:250_t:CDS:1 n=1 Tax=Acaulospora morrowiae TaxID=94023 RepID=A0A9N9CF48_9GLOM|nr:250_t:CDS:2 [Acaulospora morrowiae]